MKPFRITLHCTDSPNGQAVPIETIRKWHLDRGFKDVGYHAVIQPDGELQKGRGLNEEGAHVESAKEGNIGICLVGKDKYTIPQWQRLRSFLDDLKMTYDIRPWMIQGHRDFESARKQGKTCPNVETSRVVAWYVGQWDEAIQPHILKEAA